MVSILSVKAIGSIGENMTNTELLICKSKILKCLTEDFKRNQAIFDQQGWQVFNGTDLDMVMDKVVKGLKFAQSDINATKMLPQNRNDQRATSRRQRQTHHRFDSLLCAGVLLPRFRERDQFRLKPARLNPQRFQLGLKQGQLRL
jgi:hypothetical protein